MPTRKITPRIPHVEEPSSRSTRASHSQPDAATLAKELEAAKAKLHELEEELSLARPVPFYKRINLPNLSLPILALFYATASVYFVLRDRWFDDASIRDAYKETWCQLGQSVCSLSLPSYFLIIIGCFLALFVVMMIQRTKIPPFTNPVSAAPSRSDAVLPSAQKQAGLALLVVSAAAFLVQAIVNPLFIRLPGWDLILIIAAWFAGWALREIDFRNWPGSVRANWDYYATLILGQFALLCFLAAIYAHQDLVWAMALLLLFAAAMLFRFRKRISAIYWVFSLSLVLFSYNLNAWWISVVGDEFTMIDLDRYVAFKYSWIEWGDNLFSAKGPFDKIPKFTTYLQAITIRIFGGDNFGWRINDPILCAFAIVLFYLFLKAFTSRRTALTAAILLGVSSYVMGFGKIGYSNIQALVLLCLLLAVSAWALSSNRRIAFAALGLSIATCFYSYPGALYVVPIPILLLLIYMPPVSWKAADRWALVLGTALAVIFPLFFQPVYWAEKLPGTFLSSDAALANSPSNLASHFLSNLLYAFFSFLYIPAETHFIAASYVDPLTGLFVAIGIFLLIRNLTNRFTAFLAAGFVELLVVAGTTHADAFPPNTRMFVLLPWFAMLAAFAIDWFLARMELAKVWLPRASVAVLSAILVGAGILNFIQNQVIAPKVYFPRASLEALFVRLANQAFEKEPYTPWNYVVILDNTWGVSGLQRFTDLYVEVFRNTRIGQVTVNGPTLPEESKTLLADRNTLIILLPWMDQTWQDGLKTPLGELGKIPCPYFYVDGRPKLMVYMDPDMASICQTPG